MTASPIVGRVGYELTKGSSRPNYGPVVGNVKPEMHTVGDGRDGLIVYLQGDSVRSILEQMMASDAGNRFIRNSMQVDRGVVIATFNPWISLKDLIGLTEKVSSYDLCEQREISFSSDLHPAQAVIVRGVAASAKDITRGGFYLDVSGVRARILVDYTYALHLNQRYLSSRTITVVGRVRSVPRSEITAFGVSVEVE